jgi:hypothetical protein
MHARVSLTAVHLCDVMVQVKAVQVFHFTHFLSRKISCINVVIPSFNCCFVGCWQSSGIVPSFKGLVVDFSLLST